MRVARARVSLRVGVNVSFFFRKRPLAFKIKGKKESIMKLKGDSYLLIGATNDILFKIIIIGTPAKRQLNGVFLADRRWPSYGGVWILFPIIN